MIKNIIIGQNSFVTKSIKKHLKDPLIFSANELSKKSINEKINYYKKINLIFNNFYPSKLLNNLDHKNYNELCNLSLERISLIFETIPSRNFFRDNYNDLSVEFDYHVNFENNDNDFLPFKIKLLIKDRELINLNIEVKFSGSEMSGKLSSKYKFELPKNFSFLISNV